MTLEPANMRAPGYMIELLKNTGMPAELEAFLINRLTTNTTPTLSAALYTHLGELYLRQDNAVGAISALNAALNLQPMDPWVNKVVGDYFYAQEHFQQAVEHYAIAAAVFKDTVTWLRLGDSYAHLPNRQLAAQAYCQVLASDAANAAALAGLARLDTDCD